jgi:hypothetical protein
MTSLRVATKQKNFDCGTTRSVSNPFRSKVKAMKKELPVRHWRTLPEAILVAELIRRTREA